MLLKLSLSLLRLFPTGAIYAPQVQGPCHSRSDNPLRALSQPARLAARRAPALPAP